MSNYNEDNKTLVITLPEKITANNAEKIREDIVELEEIHKPEMAEVDMNGVVYISSAGLRILLWLTKKYGKISIYNVDDGVKEIITVSGLIKLMDIK